MSLPSRERGLKFSLCYDISQRVTVAPLAGAWIEITRRSAVLIAFHVAPLAGAWIEICFLLCYWLSYSVAPLAGAWIEIRKDPDIQRF